MQSCSGLAGQRSLAFLGIIAAFCCSVTLAQMPGKEGGATADTVSSAGKEAQDKGKRVLEEVYVTAQKREEVSQKVPISMSVMTVEFLEEQGITDIEQALEFTPNFEIQEAQTEGGGLRGASQRAPRCRGFTVDPSNPAFEPPCGVAVDGVGYTRALWFTSALYDTKRLEVLRGPQGTTFGKNTTGGLISLVSKDPSEEFTADVGAKYGTRLRRLEAGAGGPALPGFLNFRVAGVKDESHSHMTNTAAATNDVDKHPISETKGFRIKLAFPDLLGSTLTLTHERVDILNAGSSGQKVLTDIYESRESRSDEWSRQWDPNAEFNLDYKNSYIENFGTATELARSQVDWSYDIGGWAIDLVAAKGTIEGNQFGSFLPQVVQLSSSEDNPTATAELRLFSPDLPGLFGLSRLFGVDLGNSDILAGVYYQRHTLTAFVSSTLFLYELGGFGHSNDRGVVLPPYSETPPGMLGIPQPTNSGTRFFEQETETRAVFARTRWYITNQWLLQVAARFSEESKDGFWESDDTSTPETNAFFAEFTKEKTIFERDVQPKVTLGFSPTDDLNFFAHWSRGFKAGGFNMVIPFDPEAEGAERAQNRERFDGVAPAFDYPSETATDLGLDMKMSLLDGSMQLNVSLFRLDLEDFQVLVNVRDEDLSDALPNSVGTITGRQPNPLTGFPTVLSAPLARSEGAEIDLAWLATNWLTLRGTIGFNHTEFQDFTFNVCEATDKNADGDDDDRCDASGRAFAQTPRWNNTLVASINLPLGGWLDALSGIDFIASANVRYKSEHFKNDSMQPTWSRAPVSGRAKKWASYRFGFNLGIRHAVQGWSLRLQVENPLDRLYWSGEEFPNLNIVSVEPPRTVTAQFNWHY